MSTKEASPTTQEAHLLIWHSPIFPAHHSLFIPDLSDKFSPLTTTGKLINIRGNSYSGFHHEIIRFYNPSEYTGKQSHILLGSFDFESIKLPPALESDNHSEINSKEWDADKNPTPVDLLEKLALELPAPSKSLNAVSPSSSSTGPTTLRRVQLKNCQTWMKDYVDLLVRERVLGEEAREALEKAAKN